MHQHTGIYIHFPYCDFKCAYCDFYSIAQKDPDPDFYDLYVDHLKQDILLKKKYMRHGNIINSIFMGGGTPSKVPVKHIQDILSFIRKNLKLSSRIEITLEANPESVITEKLEQYLNIGINRIHIGIQSRQPKLMDYLQRYYHSESYDTVLDKVKKAGFMNYGVDLIYGIPSQRVKNLKEELSWAIGEGVTHISAYCLTIEENTLLKRQIGQGIKKRPSYRRQSYHYEFVTEYLDKKGFIRYEISNFCRKNYQCMHNLGYWKYRPYLGIGVSSHSFLESYRFVAPASLDEYMKGNYFQEESSQTIPDIFIGIFRLLSFQSFRNIRNYLEKDQFEIFYDMIQNFSKKNWISIFPKGFQLTSQGARFSDTMILQMSRAF